jgi:hypothetical protein
MDRGRKIAALDGEEEKEEEKEWHRRLAKRSPTSRFGSENCRGAD